MAPHEGAPLSDRERDIVDLLLDVDVPGVAALRQQAHHATVSRRCACGCPTIWLAVDRERAPAIADLTRRLVSKAATPAPTPAPLHIHLYVEDGWLHQVELIPLSQPVPTRFPSPSELGAPVPGSQPLGPSGPPPASPNGNRQWILP